MLSRWSLIGLAALLTVCAVFAVEDASAKKPPPGGDESDPAITYVRVRTKTGGKIANEATLMVMDADGSNQTEVRKESFALSSGYDLRHPSWSPDGTKIVFARVAFGWNGPGWGIHTINVDGSGLFQVTSGSGQAPAWSPDGARIAYVKNGDVRLVDVDGTDDTQLTFTDADEGAPAWSPGGSQLAYVLQGDLLVHDLGTGAVTNVTADGPLSGMVYHGRDLGGPDWARTQDLIAVVDTDGDLWIVDPDAPANPVQLTDSTEVESSPSWSPDDSKIVFGRQGDIYSIDADGTGETQLAEGNPPKKWTSEGVGRPDWKR